MNSRPPSSSSKLGPNASLRRQPLLAPALAFAAGLTLAPRSDLPAWGLHPFTAASIVGVGAVLALVLPAVRGLRPTRRSVEAILLGFPFVLGSFAGRPESLEPNAFEPVLVTDMATAPLLLRGRVTSAPRALASRLTTRMSETETRVRFEMTIDTSLAATLDFPSPRVMVVAAGDPAVARGDEVRVTGRRVGDTACVVTRNAHHVVVIASSRFAPLAVGDRARRALRRGCRQRFSPSTAGWLGALVLGERSSLDARTPERFRRIGQSHLIAISGLHVGLIAATVLIPMRRSRRGWRISTALVAILVLAYAGLAGGDPPVLRAAVLGLGAALAAARGRPANLLHGTSLALLIVGCLVGDQTDRPSFVLSFAAVFAIAWLGTAPLAEVDPSRSARWTRFRRTLRISFAAWAGASAALVWWSAEVVPAAPLFTLALVPCVGLLLTLGVFAALVPASGLDLGIDACARAVIVVLEALARTFDALPGTPWSWPPAPPVVLALVVLAAACVASRPRAWRASATCLILAIVAASPPAPALGVVVLPLGRGQAVLAWSPRGVVLYDAGSLDREEGGARDIARALRDIHRSTIDLVVLSHSHLDHVDAIRGLVDRGCVRNVLVGPRFTANDLGSATWEWLGRRGVPRLVADPSTRLQVGDWIVGALHPPEARTAPVSVNDDSLVCHLSGPGIELLLTGDLEKRGLAEFSPAHRAEIVVLPHHGRYSEGLEAWLSSLRPRAVVASTPARGLPARTRAVVDGLGIAAYCTAGRRLAITPTSSGWTVTRPARD